jgi:hypothetical protein
MDLPELSRAVEQLALTVAFEDGLAELVAVDGCGIGLVGGVEAQADGDGVALG